MMRNMLSRSSGAFKYSIFVILLMSGTISGFRAQTPAPKDAPGVPGSPGTSQKQADTSKSDEEVAVFQIRSAFSLTPAMVQALQKKMDEYVAQSGTGQSGTGQSGTVSGAGHSPEAPSAQGSSPAKAQPKTDVIATIPWSDLISQSVPMATPFDIRVVGEKIVAIMQIVPLDRDVKGVNLMIQTQLWSKQADGTVSYRTFVQPLSLPVGARIFYYPLGFNPKEGAPIVVEIRVDIVERPKKLH